MEKYPSICLNKDKPSYAIWHVDVNSWTLQGGRNLVRAMDVGEPMSIQLSLYAWDLYGLMAITWKLSNLWPPAKAIRYTCYDSHKIGIWTILVA